MLSEEKLEAAFTQAKTDALAFVKEHNEKLPTDACPKCGEDSHIPGLRCPRCGYRHNVPWAVIRDTEWGYEVVPLNDRHAILHEFKVDLPE